MSESAVSVQNVSKKYKIFRSNQERMLDLINPFKHYHRDFWALEDVSFEVPKGKTYGLVGKNGSGKSTLLQIIAGVLSPTQGNVNIQGRVSALLELGAGFNPQFSGRDNVILNGVVMGLSKEEIEDRMPAIIEFSELEDFVDQPVRTYSSGMYIRLAFSAAIHVDPDIFIVDEALAVGDARFQRKCYRKFEQFKELGKTILLVTHDSNAVVRHCDAAVLMNGGQMLEVGNSKDIINHYTEIMLASENAGSKGKKGQNASQTKKPADDESKSSMDVKSLLEQFLEDKHPDDRCPSRYSYNDQEHRYGNQKAQIVDYALVSNGVWDRNSLRSNDQLEIYIKVLFHDAVKIPIYGVTFKRLDGVEVYGSNSLFEETAVQATSAGDMVVFHVTVRMNLTFGDYFMSLGIAEDADGEVIPLDRRYDLIHLQIHQTNRSFGIVDLDASYSEHHVV